MNFYTTNSQISLPNSKEMQSSSDMIDIQIEESLVRETLMSIDSSNFKEDIITLICFFTVLFFSVLLGILGSSAISVQNSVKQLSNSNENEQFSFVSTTISTYHRFITFSLKMAPKNRLNTIENHLSFNYRVTCHNGKDIVNDFENRYDMIPLGPKSDQYIFIYNDKIINYNSIKLNINFEKASLQFSNFTMRTEIGLPFHTMFQIYFRVIFGSFQLFFLISLYIRLKTMPIKLWHLEQKLTVPLLILAFLYDNPFYFIQIIFPSKFFIIMNTIVVSVFISYFRFFMIVLFDSLRFKNRKTDQCFLGPKLVFLFASFIVAAFCGVYDDLKSFEQNSLDYDPNKKNISFPNLFIIAVYHFWLVYSISNASCEVDITERYKFNMYFAACMVSFVVSYSVEIPSFFQVSDFFRYSSLYFIITFAVKNVLTLLMAYFHWPYEMLHEQHYIDSADDFSAADPGEFFTSNLDSDK